MEYGKVPDCANVNEKRREYKRVANFRQYSWYFFAFGIYIFCAAVGFGIAYFVLVFMVNMNVKP